MYTYVYVYVYVETRKWQRCTAAVSDSNANCLYDSISSAQLKIIQNDKEKSISVMPNLFEDEN